MRVAIWIITLLRHFLMALRFDDHIAEMSIGSMVPLPLQCWAEEADVWASLLRFLVLIETGTQNVMLQLPACKQTI